jgi:heptosyltransferase-2
MNERILVRCVNWLGDAVMSTPALQRLREARPHAHITLLSQGKLGDLWQGQPFADAVMTFGKNESVWSVARRLREQRFDVGIAFPNSFRAGLELRLAGIPERFGYAGRGRRFLLNRTISRRAEAVKMHKRSDAEIRQLVDKPAEWSSVPEAAHHIHDYLGIVAAVGASAEPLPTKIFVSKEEMTRAREKWGVADETVFGLNPGAEYGPAKRWPPERFATAAAMLQQRHGARWIIFGGAADKATCDSIAEQIGTSSDKKPINVAGQTTLRELAALLKVCRIVLTNDTGPMHLAAAVGTPVVVPFGSTSPELTAPIFDASKIVRTNVGCSPCFRRECPIDFRCMKGIEVGAIVDAVEEILTTKTPRHEES